MFGYQKKMPETKLDADVELLIHGASFPIVNPLGIDINTLNNWKSGTTKPRPAKVRDTAVTLCNAIKNRADDQESLLKKARIIATKYCPDELSDLNNLGNFPAFIFRLAENREKLQEEKPVEQKPAKKKSSKRIISSKRHKERVRAHLPRNPEQTNQFQKVETDIVCSRCITNRFRCIVSGGMQKHPSGNSSCCI